MTPEERFNVRQTPDITIGDYEHNDGILCSSAGKFSSLAISTGDGEYTLSTDELDQLHEWIHRRIDLFNVTAKEGVG